MAELLAFHGKPVIKQKYLRRVRAHRRADEIVKGIYWEKGKGCAVGCTVHSSQHAAYETELGIPEALAHLEDILFENLPNGIAKDWPERFLSAARSGADLTPVPHRFLAWLQLWNAERMTKWPEVEKVNRQVAALHERAAKGDMPTAKEWSAARSAAERSSWTSGARSAVWSAASAAESAAYITFADKLIELMEAA